MGCHDALSPSPAIWDLAPVYNMFSEVFLTEGGGDYFLRAAVMMFVPAGGGKSRRVAPSLGHLEHHNLVHLSLCFAFFASLRFASFAALALLASLGVIASPASLGSLGSLRLARLGAWSEKFLAHLDIKMFWNI